MAEKKEYKWQVRPGGTVPVDALNVVAATSQTGSTSLKKSLGINKGGESAPAIDAQSLGVAHATNVPDHSFGKTQFAKAEGTPQMDASSGAIAHALAAPKPPASVNAVDKTQMVRNNAQSN